MCVNEIMANKNKSTVGTIFILLALTPFKFAAAQAPLSIFIAICIALIGVFLLFSAYKKENN